MSTTMLTLAGVLSLLASGCTYSKIVIPHPNPHVADVIVVPGFALDSDGRARGLLFNRMAMAGLLLDRGVASKILVSGGKPRGGITEAHRMASLARRLGISPGALIIEPLAVSTLENARFSADILRRQGVRSALPLTDGLHLAYALPVFRQAYADRGIKLAWAPVDYDELKEAGLFRGYLQACD